MRDWQQSLLPSFRSRTLPTTPIDEVAMNKGIRYFNFPIYLLRGFLVNSRQVLDNICDYCLYEHTLKFDDNDNDEDEAIVQRMKLAMKFYNIKLADPIASFERGQKLYATLPVSCPYAGLNLRIYWDYYDNQKTDFEKACLLTFLAIKSILGNKRYCKITNKFIVSRMEGKPKVSNNISPAVQKFAKEYQLNKIKNELELNWHLVSYGKAVRGFYVSFDLTLDDLAYIAEMNREKYRSLKLKNEKKLAAQKARERIKNEQRISRPI
ncbi:hypothetical protein FLLO111716_01165 [Flavobacterium longum]